MKRTFFLLLISSLFNSCVFSEMNETATAYYFFRDADFNKTLNYTEGQKLKYINQQNEELIFEITGKQLNFESGYRTNSGGMGFFSSSSSYSADFYYDNINYYGVKYTTNNSYYSFMVSLKRFPIDVQEALKDSTTEVPSEFTGFIKFPFWNGSNNEININYHQSKISITTSNKTYTSVIKIESDNTIVNHPICNVNILYYDTADGLIGFDDTLGNQWRIAN